MIWLCLSLFILMMTAPFVLSWYFTGKKKREGEKCLLIEEEKEVPGSTECIEHIAAAYGKRFYDLLQTESYF